MVQLKKLLKIFKLLSQDKYMDFYALQMSPRKKKTDDGQQEDTKKIQEHVVSKEELITELANARSDVKLEPENKKSLTSFLTSHIGYFRPDSNRDEVESAETGQLKESDAGKMEKETTVSDKTKQDSIIQVEPDKDSEKKDQIDTAIVVKKKRDRVLADIWREEPVKKEKKKILVAKSVATPATAKFEADVVIGQAQTKGSQQALSEIEEKVLAAFVEAARTSDEKKLSTVLDQMMALRSENPERCEGDYPLNVEIKKKLIGGIPALFAYKGAKSVIHVLQLLDELNIQIGSNDLDALPDEILQSKEMKATAEKYLLWCVRQYANFPGELERKIASFARSGILSYVELPTLSNLHKEIFNELILFVKENVKNPLEIEHKIYEYALAGFVSGSEFKNNEKVRGFVKRFLGKLIEKNQGNPKGMTKKIAEYEQVGLISSEEIFQDDKIQKIIEKYLLKFGKDNLSHPRKVSARIKEYFDIGLINKQTRDNFLRNI